MRVRYAALVVVLALATGAAGAQSAPALRGVDPRPNIVVVMTDDQTVESLRVMKNVKRLLIDEGTTFTNSIATFPLCCPSRATLLTGQYSHNHRVVGNSYRNGLARLDERRTLPVWLRRAGYATVLIGKYLNGYGKYRSRRVPPGWSEWHASTYLAYYGHTINHNGRLVTYRGRGSYLTDVYARLARNVVRRRARSPRPFFLWLSFFAPHGGGPRELDDPAEFITPAPADRHRDYFASEPLPQSAALNEADLGDKPGALAARTPLSAVTLAGLRELYQQRLESLLAVDEAVASLVTALRASGELERTLILFTSDNGFFHGEHRIPHGKVFLYEPALRVPLIARGPQVPRGLQLDQPVANIDLAPTIVAAARARPGRRFDGRSLLPLFRDPSLYWGRDILIERGPGDDGGGSRLTVGIRTPRYVYAEHVSGERELYDLAIDPEQLQSVAADPRYGLIVAGLDQRLERLRSCAGAVCRRRPVLELSLLRDDGCAKLARVWGADKGAVESIDFHLDGKPVLRVNAAPFDLPLAPGAVRTGTKLRAVAVLVDGRRVTLDRRAQRC